MGDYENIIKNSVKLDCHIYKWSQKIRLGNKHDGGYIIADNIGPYDCYLSCGVAYDESFTHDFVNKFSMNELNSFAFDGTVDRYPWEYTTNISFIRKNISDVSDDMHTDLQYYLEHYTDIFLKMDIEGGEYKWISRTSNFKNIKQMVIEFHNISTSGHIYECIKKIEETHVIVHVHGNNYGGVINNLPNVIELTCVRRNVVDTWTSNKICFPIEGLDNPNNPYVNDIFLGSQPLQSPRIAVWIENNWAFGRIAQSLNKYANVDVYDWRSVKSNSILWMDAWKYYDYIVSTSLILTMDFIPKDAFKKLIVVIMHGEFENSYFVEVDKIEEGVRYGGICMSIVSYMKDKGYPDPIWAPWGVDIDLFPIKYSVNGPIRRIGMIASDMDENSIYSLNKGYAMFQSICDTVGAESVYIRNKPEDQIYDDIDLLICCSRVEGGPFGIFEASASGLPVMSTPVGNMINVNGLILFTTVQEAVDQIRAWNQNTSELYSYASRITSEIRTNWSMEKCVDRFIKNISPPFIDLQPPTVTLTITTCKRLDNFCRTMDALIKHCKDLCDVLVVDDSSTYSDRIEMQKRYPFIALVSHNKKSHAHSLNIIRDVVKTDYILMFEDDWICHKDFSIHEVIKYMQKSGIDNLRLNSHFRNDDLVQVQFNPDRMVPEYKEWCNQRGYILEHSGVGEGWPGFSLNPTMLHRSVLDEPFDENIPSGFMEFDYAIRHVNKKWYGKDICGLEHNDGGKCAYVLNNTNRWWDKSCS